MFNLNDPNFWPSISALGQCAAAVATLSAVVLALKQSRDACLTKVNVSQAIGIDADSGSSIIVFKAVNMSKRPVHLEATGVLMENNEQMVFVQDQRIAVPKQLQELEATKYFVPCKLLADTLKEKGYSGRGVKLRLYFSDSRDVRFWKVFKFDVERWGK